MRHCLHTIDSSRDDRGFSLVELLVGVLISTLLLAGFGAFYRSEQRATRHQQIEIETSQELRSALEQISRDLRSAGKNVTGATGIAGFPFTTAANNNVEFTLDANDDGVATLTDPNEHKGFRMTGTTVEEYDATPGNTGWWPLANNVSALQFTYWDCAQATALTAPVAAPGASIARVDVSITASRPVIAGLPTTRTEVESVRLRNVGCP